MPSLVENGLVVQEKKMKMKMWKVYDNANDNNDNDGQRTTDKFWSEKLTWAFGSGELKTIMWLTAHVLGSYMYSQLFIQFF